MAETSQSETTRINTSIQQILLIGESFDRLLERYKQPQADSLAAGTICEIQSRVHQEFHRAQRLHADLSVTVPTSERSNYKYFAESHWEGFNYTFEELDNLLLSKLNQLYKDREAEHGTSSTMHSLHTSSPIHRVNDTVNVCEPQTLVALPKLNIKPFDGSYDQWQNFNDTFNSAVDRHPKLTPVQKLQYLKCSVTGRAEQILRPITITAANYEVARDLLKKRFENLRKLINSHLNKLHALPHVTQDNQVNMSLMRDTLQITIESLKNLNCNAEQWSTPIIHQMTMKFSVGVKKEWERSLKRRVDYPDFNHFFNFLDDQLVMLENIEPNREGAKEEGSKSSVNKAKSTHNASVNSSSNKCLSCGENHPLYKCSSFIKLSVQDRQKLRQKHNLCVNCLSSGHKLNACKCQTGCRKCSKQHHTLLHYDTKKEEKTDSTAKPSSNNNNKSQNNTNPGGSQNPGESPSTTSLHNAPAHSEVMLATALVKVKSEGGRSLVTRAMIDPGSESSFVSESLAQTLRLQRYKTDTVINGLQGVQTSAPRFSTSFEVTAARRTSPSYHVNAYILQAITAYKPKAFRPNHYQELRRLLLADPEPSRAYRIDILLGADVMGQLLEPGLVRLQDSEVVAQSTKLGWILSGPVNSPPERSITVQHATFALDHSLKQFWEVEDFPSKPLLSSEDEHCERIFCNTTNRDETGPFTTALPFKTATEHEKLGESKSIALASWRRVEARLQRNPELKRQYDDFMKEYQDLGHMTEISNDQEDDTKYVFLPHHAVLKEDSLTTKVRIVFNASSNTRTGVSLNDTLRTGAKLQNDIADVITNWRRHRYVLTADVSKMFRQILIREEDRKYQCILWQQPQDDAVKSYKLNTVTYGTKPAPFLANRVIKAIIEEHGSEYPLAIEPLDRDTYVDDVLFGADSKESIKEIRNQVEAILKRGCLDLRKWVSNSPDLLPNATSVTDELYIKPEDNTERKVLGIVWSSKQDAFSVKLGEVGTTQITKRTILSHIARLYDPLGWCSPFVIRAKVLMQSLWIAKSDWDDPNLPSDCIEAWLTWCRELPELTKVSIPRFFGAGLESAKIHLVGFSDASARAYSAVAYFYVEFIDGKYKSNLIAAKTKVAPIKTQSIPRLELCGAVLLTKLVHKQNPADLNSRGLSSIALVESKLWWHGPSLTFDKGSCLQDADDQQIAKDVASEARKALTTLLATPELPSYLLRFSSWMKLIRVLAWWYKYIDILFYKIKEKQTVVRPKCVLSREMIQQAETHVFRVLQRIAFKAELTALQQNRSIDRASLLRQLSPFIDEEGLLRVGGRLQNSELPYQQKHPVILPKGRVTNLLIKHTHLKALHGGLQLTLALLRERYWVIHARNSVKLVLSRCTICIRYKANTLWQQMAPLPKARCAASRPFSHVGIDYAGPFDMRNMSGRGHKTHKVWLAIFACFVTRAIHLEIVNDYSSNAFLAAFKCFTSRRGLPSDVYSDRGTTFKGADRELKQQFQQVTSNKDVLNSLTSYGIEWHFIPPAAAHQGGLWESGVRAVKYHLRRVMGSFTPTWEEMRTILCEIEASLNSRPITPLMDSSPDELALTPGHFLIGTSLKAVPEPSLLDQKENLMTRWEVTSKIVQSFWKRWHSEYLQQLQRRHKWQDQCENVKQGDVVLLLDPNRPPGDWALARVEEANPGHDGLVRDVILWTRGTRLHRPITRLIKLPTDTTLSPHFTLILLCQHFNFVVLPPNTFKTNRFCLNLFYTSSLTFFIFPTLHSNFLFCFVLHFTAMTSPQECLQLDNDVQFTDNETEPIRPMRKSLDQRLLELFGESPPHLNTPQVLSSHHATARTGDSLQRPYVEAGTSKEKSHYNSICSPVSSPGMEQAWREVNETPDPEYMRRVHPVRAKVERVTVTIDAPHPDNPNLIQPRQYHITVPVAVLEHNVNRPNWKWRAFVPAGKLIIYFRSGVAAGARLNRRQRENGPPQDPRPQPARRETSPTRSKTGLRSVVVVPQHSALHPSKRQCLATERCGEHRH